MKKKLQNGIATCDECRKSYDATKRKYAHSCPYCSNDVWKLKPRYESGWTDEAFVNWLNELGWKVKLKD